MSSKLIPMRFFLKVNYLWLCAVHLGVEYHIDVYDKNINKEVQVQNVWSIKDANECQRFDCHLSASVG